jgi:hypothetical protein
MTHAHLSLSGKRLTTPRAAAFAGILFAILFTVSVTLIRISLPPGPVDGTLWQEKHASLLNVGVILMPCAGISFLGLVGVVRDRLGIYEDQFVSTIFYGSALLFLAMVFSATAVTGGIATGYAANPELSAAGEIYAFGRALVGQFFTIYALRMAGVFVLSLGTIWLRTGVMPRWLSLITFVFALVLILSASLNLWMVLVFPAWVFIISCYILFLNLRTKHTGMADGITASQPDQNA